jgi:AraC family transcriptional regulator, regulatory protein of adaptative response / methylated-DNA-[protein]-cysteine methyltransferase
MSTSTFISDESRWTAIVDRDRSADGTFYYAVKTTGVFCCPSCSARRPNRPNVEYYLTCLEAEAAGYRPCKKCTPGTISKKEEIKQKIIRACRKIEQSDSTIKLSELAAEAELSPYHFHRLFKKIAGVTPKQYSTAHKSHQFRKSLKTSRSVTEAIYTAGYNSSSAAYDKKHDHLAMKPKDFRKGAAGITITYGLTKCSLGWIIVASTERGVCAIEFGDIPETLPTQVQQRFPKAQLQKAGAGFTALLEEVVRFVEYPRSECNIPLDIQGTVFQQKVWSVLRQIKPGETLSYSEIAEKIGKSKAVRAVATACSSNKLAVVIPCHRVISKTGEISGYRWGVERKKMLLAKERGDE